MLIVVVVVVVVVIETFGLFSSFELSDVLSVAPLPNTHPKHAYT